MNDMLVSVIIPIYNREKIIKKCIDSVINQTYKNIEILLVDDASTDNSYKVMEEYNNKYSNVRIFTYEENKGVGHARNVGIENSKGDYIIFIDSDDYIDNDYVETLVNNIGDSDLICCGYKNVDSNGNIKKINTLKNNSYGIFRYPVIWARMYTASSIKDNKIRFSDMRSRQDIRFLLEYIAGINSSVSIDYNGYNNVLSGDDKITGNANLIKKRNVEEIFLNLDQVLTKKNYNSKYKMEIYYFVVKDLVFNVFTLAKYISYSSLKEYDGKSYSYIKTIFKNHNTKIHFVKKYDTFTNWFIINVYILFHKLNLQDILLRIIQQLLYVEE